MAVAKVGNGREQRWSGGSHENGLGDDDSSRVALKEEDENSVFPCQETSPKNRRKIRPPKQYKPETRDGDKGNPESTEELSGTMQTCSSTSPTSVIVDQTRNDVILESAVHVMTASQAPKEVDSSSHSKRTANSQKAKRPPSSRSTCRKPKADTPAVPRKPEDLIKEAMILGQTSPAASKRDAQYRKSYAYKIWKERANHEVRSETTEERNGTNKHDGELQRQSRAVFYWPPNPNKGTKPPGFFANGKYYPMNPQMIRPIFGDPPVTQALPFIPVGSKGKQADVACKPSVTNSVIHPSNGVVVSPGRLGTVRHGVSSGMETLKRTKCVENIAPPNAVVVPQHTRTKAQSPPVHIPPEKSPEVKTPPLFKPPSSASVVSPAPSSPREATSEVTPLAKTSQVQTPPTSINLGSNFPVERIEANEDKASPATTSPSNLVSLVKTSLRQKHAKENVPSLPNMFKSKRKLKGERTDGPGAKKTKATIFTPLNEQEAEKLANDIYDVNLEYFPFQTLAEKAARGKNNTGEGSDSSQRERRIKEIEKVRCLLKDFYDVTFSCAEDPDMEKFDSASRKFGRKNILNHLSLLDCYFAELQKKLE